MRDVYTYNMIREGKCNSISLSQTINESGCIADGAVNEFGVILGSAQRVAAVYGRRSSSAGHGNGTVKEA